MKTSQIPWKRYYGDDGQLSKEVDKSPLLKLLHAAYTHWVSDNCHLRDFPSAVNHVAACVLGDYVVHGAPKLHGRLPKPPSLGLAGQSSPRSQEQLRLYDELNTLSPDIDLTQVERSMRYGFVKWVAEGFHPRDFAQFATDCASAIVYDHMLVQQLAGLGGGRTEKQFLSEPYDG